MLEGRRIRYLLCIWEIRFPSSAPIFFFARKAYIRPESTTRITELKRACHDDMHFIANLLCSISILPREKTDLLIDTLEGKRQPEPRTGKEQHYAVKKPSCQLLGLLPTIGDAETVCAESALCSALSNDSKALFPP